MSSFRCVTRFAVAAVLAAGLGTALLAAFVFILAAAGFLSLGLLVLILLAGAAAGLGPVRRSAAGVPVPAADETLK